MVILRSGRLSPFTPVVWKAIFTGKTEESEPQPKPEIVHWNSAALNWLRSKKLARRLYAFLLRKRFLRAGFPERLGFGRKDLLQEADTFISRSSKPIMIHNPLKADVKWEVKGLHSPFDPSEIAESQVKVFQKERLETLARLKDDWDLFVVYTKLLDIVGHLFWQRDETMEEYYQLVEDFARDIQSSLSDETFMMVISDHGMRPLEGTRQQGGEHSHHAYASFSHEIEAPPPREITDLSPIISELLRRRKDEDLIKEKLKELGYI